LKGKKKPITKCDDKERGGQLNNSPRNGAIRTAPDAPPVRKPKMAIITHRRRKFGYQVREFPGRTKGDVA